MTNERMTNEEAIRMLKAKLACLSMDTSSCYSECNEELCDECPLNYEQGNMGEQKEYIRMSIEALERKSCEDTISRQAAIEVIWDGINMDIYTREVKECLEALPPVTPQQKMGHWIETAEEYYKAINEKGGGVNENTPYFTDDIACSECLAKFSVIDNETERFKCCPTCGAKMQEVEE